MCSSVNVLSGETSKDYWTGKAYSADTVTEGQIHNVSKKIIECRNR